MAKTVEKKASEQAVEIDRSVAVERDILEPCLKRLNAKGFDQELRLEVSDEGQVAAIVWGRHQGVDTPRILVWAVLPEYWDGVNQAIATPKLIRVLGAIAPLIEGGQGHPAPSLPPVDRQDPSQNWIKGRLIKLPDVASADYSPARSLSPHSVLSGSLADYQPPDPDIPGADTMYWVLARPWCFLLGQIVFTQEAWSAERITGDGKRILLIPLRESDFVQLVNFLYPHPASDEAARALWQHFNPDGDIPTAEATHIAPSIAMMERLNLRYRKQNQTSIIFRDPDQSNAYEQAIANRKQQRPEEKALEVLTGAMRILDQNWLYDPIPAQLGGDLTQLRRNLSTDKTEMGGCSTAMP